MPIDIIMTVAVFVVMVGTACFLGWLVSDSQRRGRSGGLDAVLFFILGPLVAGTVHAGRTQRRLIDRRPEEYRTAEEALDGASRLEALGEWEAALELYRSAGTRWPEHAAYAEKCREAIRQKQAAGAV